MKTSYQKLKHVPIGRVLLLAPLLLSACATPGYQCKRGEACAPVHNTYDDAVRAQGSWRPLWNVRGHSFGKKRKHGWFSGWFSDKHEHKHLKPVRGSWSRAGRKPRRLFTSRHARGGYGWDRGSTPTATCAPASTYGSLRRDTGTTPARFGRWAGSANT